MQGGNPKPTDDQQRRCAVCYMAKGYTVPVVYVFNIAPYGQVIERLESTEPQVTVIDFEFPFYPVGPPLV